MIKVKPRHGYEIIREIEEKSYGFYKPSPGVIYPTLQALEEMGYAKSEENEGKKTYSITENGLKFLEEKKGISDDLKIHIKHDWNFKNISQKAMVIGSCHDLRDLVHDSIRRLDKAKTKRIVAIISQARRDIEAILGE